MGIIQPEPRFKIESDGTIQGTRVIDIETGLPVEFVTEVSWHMSIFDPYPEIKMTVKPGAVDVVGGILNEKG